MGGRDISSQKREDENGLSFASVLALSVTCGDTSPKGRGSGETGSLAAMPGALPLGELPSGARLRGLAFPRRAAASVGSRHGIRPLPSKLYP